MRKLSGGAPCEMAMVGDIAALEEVKRDIALFYLLFLLFSSPLAWFLTLRSLEPMRESIATIDSFINGIFHDINTPLSIIKVSSQSMQMRLESENERIKNGRVLQGVSDIEALQEQLLFALKSERYQLKKQQFDLKALLESRLEYYNAIREKLHVKYALETLVIEADEKAMVRIIDNIIHNAIKFSPKDATVLVELKNGRLTVIDRGKGIAKVDEVFGKYYRENSDVKGLGLGLFVVKSLCDKHGIALSVDSKVGEGTRFQLDLASVVV